MKLLTDLEKYDYELYNLQINRKCVRDTSKCLGHAFSVRLMLRQSSQLCLVVEIEHFEDFKS